MKDLEFVTEGALVVGGGPAGSTAAAALARRGVPVLLVDRAQFPRDKVCGDGISPFALEGLASIGFDLKRFDSHQRVDRCEFVSPGGRSWLAHYPPLAGETPDYGHVIPRSQFDQVLLQHAIDCGVRVELGVRFKSLKRSGGQIREVVLQNGEDSICLTPGVLLAADGDHSTIRRELSGRRKRAQDWLAVRGYVDHLQHPVPQMSFHFSDAVRPGYGWIFPEGHNEHGHRANCGVYVHQRTLGRTDRSLKQLYREFIDPLLQKRDSPLFGGSHDGAPKGYPITPYHPQRQVQFDNALLIGDAAGVADPLTGEGIGPAIGSGLEAAQAAHNYLKSGDLSALKRYPGALQRRFRSIRRRGRFLLTLIERTPWLVDKLFLRAEQDKLLAERIFHIVSGRAPLRQVLRPDVWMRIYTPALFRKPVQ